VPPQVNARLKLAFRCRDGRQSISRPFRNDSEVVMTRTWMAVGAGALAVMALAGCATQQRSASVYKAGEAQREQIVRMGVVESVREVTIDRGQTGVGTGAGAVIGGVAGSGVGSGRGSVVGAVAGAVAGGIIGQAVENQSGKVPGVEITVRLDNGELRAIVQEIDGQQFKPGDRVRLLSQGGVTRVTR
jgi:outer membrane lipoprotein SlyB